jgi:hypothetical protein
MAMGIKSCVAAEGIEDEGTDTRELKSRLAIGETRGKWIKFGHRVLGLVDLRCWLA